MSTGKFVSLCEAAADRAERAAGVGKIVTILTGPMKGDYVVTAFGGQL